MGDLLVDPQMYAAPPDPGLLVDPSTFGVPPKPKAPPIPGMEKLGGAAPPIAPAPIPPDLAPTGQRIYTADNPPPTAGAFDREGAFALRQEEKAADFASPEFHDLMKQAVWSGYAKDVPQSDDVAENSSLAVQRLVQGLISPKAFATMLGAEGATVALKAAANLPRVASALENFPQVRQALDVAANAAIPGTFGAMGAKTAVESAPEVVKAAAFNAVGAPGAAAEHTIAAAKETPAQTAAKTIESLGGVAQAALGAKGAVDVAGETAGAYAPSQTELPARPLRPVEAQLAHDIGIESPTRTTVPAVAPEQAAATAAQLQASGNRLAAVDWEKLGRGRLPEPRQVHINGQPATVQAMGRGPGGRPFFEVVRPDGTRMYGGTGSAVQEFLAQRGAKPGVETPAEASQFSGELLVNPQEYATPIREASEISTPEETNASGPGSSELLVNPKEFATDLSKTQSEVESDYASSPESSAGAGTAGEVSPLREPRRPSNPSWFGEAVPVLVPHEDRAYQARYSVREAGDVVPSHNAVTLEENPHYWFRNDRDYRDPRNAERILKQTAAFEPAYLINDNPTSNDGPPVIDESGNVLGGNSRAMTINRVLAQRPEAYQAYKNLLVSKAAQFGLDPDVVAAMRQPVLVRQLDRQLSPDETQDAITSFNTVGTAALTSAERAISDSARLSPKTLGFISSAIDGQGPEGTLSQALEGKPGVAIVNRLVDDGIIPVADKPAYIDSRGLVTSQGKDRISKLMLGGLFRDSDQLDRTPPAIRNKLERVVAPLSRVAGNENWDLTPDLRAAVDMIEQARSSGLTNLDDLVRQQGLFGKSEYSARAVALANAIKKEGPVSLARAFNRYANESKGPTMFGEVSPAEAFSDAFGTPQELPQQGATSTGEHGAAHIPTPLVKAGEALGVDKFIQQDLRPRLSGTVRGVRDLVRGLVQMASPRTGVRQDHLDAVYKLKGDREKARFVLQAAVKHMRELFDGKGLDPAILQRVAQTRGDLISEGLTPLQTFAVDFIDRVKTGGRQATPELHNIASFLRDVDDELYNAVSQHADVPYLENHNRVIWKVIPGRLFQGRQGHPAGRRPLQGSKSFLKQHVFENMSDGIKAGGVPISYNPVEMFLHHYEDSMKFITAQRWWDMAKRLQARVFVKTGKEAPEGFERLDDRIARVYFKADQGPVNTGEWYVEAGMARLMNNYLSRDLLREEGTLVGNLGSAMLAVKNLYTSVELSLSGFHFIFISGEVGSSNIGLAISKFLNRALVHGDFGAAQEALGDFTRGVTVVPAARQAFRMGKAGMRLIADPQQFSQTPEGQWLLKQVPQAEELMDDLFQGGAKLDVNHEYIRNSMRSFGEAWRGGNYPGAILLRSIPAAMEAIQHPLFEWYIPRIKVGVFMREFSNQLLERQVDLNAGRISRAALARQSWDFVEDRFGEMNFDNLFWNRTFKSAMQIVLRSPTWRLGSMRAVAKAFGGQGKELSDAFRAGRPPRVTPPMAWLLGMAIFTAIYATLVQYAFSRKWPSHVKDLFFPQYDSLDERARFSFPSYGKEYYQLATHPLNYATAGTSGPIGRAAEIARNRDFYGEKLWNEDDPAYKQALDFMKAIAPQPISVKSFNRVREESGIGRAALSLIGVNKAPAYVTKSKAEQLLTKYSQENSPLGSRTHEEQEHMHARSKAVRELRGHKGTEAIREGLKSGTLNRKDIASIQKASKVTPLQGQFVHSNLTLSQSLDVYAAADQQERQQLRGAMVHKIRLAMEKPWEMTPTVREKIAGLGFGHPASLAVTH